MSSFVSAFRSAATANALLLLAGLICLALDWSLFFNGYPHQMRLPIMTIFATLWTPLLALLLWLTSISAGPKMSRPAALLVALALCDLLLIEMLQPGWTRNPVPIWTAARWDLVWIFASTLGAGLLFIRVQKALQQPWNGSESR